MRRFLLSAAALICLASPASSAITAWQGDLFVTAAVGGAACTAVNMNVGNFARGVFRPKGGDNGNSDLLSWHFAGSSGQVVPTSPAGGSLNGATAAIVRIIYGSAGFNQFNNWPLSGVAVSAVNGNNPITVQITITDIYSKNAATPSNCDVTFKGTLAKKP